jgi:hypothetical protein
MAFSWLNSQIFPRSQSTVDLQASSLDLRPYAYGYAATETALPHIRETTQVSLLDRPDDTITALPAPTTAVAHKRSSREHRKPPKEKKTKKSTWFRVKTSFKGTWQRLSRKKKVPPVIGQPTDFKRVGGVEVLAEAVYAQGRAEQTGGDEDDWEDVEEYVCLSYDIVNLLTTGYSHQRF